MAELKKCRSCGADIQAHAPFGHCPRCLLQTAWGTETSGEVECSYSNDIALRIEVFRPPGTALRIRDFVREYRVTLDHQTSVGKVALGSGDLWPTEMEKALTCVSATVILVLRFTDRFPDWFREMVRIFDLADQPIESSGEGTICCGGLSLSAEDLIYNIVL